MCVCVCVRRVRVFVCVCLSLCVCVCVCVRVWAETAPPLLVRDLRLGAWSGAGSDSEVECTWSAILRDKGAVTPPFLPLEAADWLAALQGRVLFGWRARADWSGDDRAGLEQRIRWEELCRRRAGQTEGNSANRVLKTTPDTAGATQESFASERAKETTRDDMEYSSSPSRKRGRIETTEETWEKETEPETAAEETWKKAEMGKRRRRLSGA